MSATLEEAIEEVRALPPDKQQQLSEIALSLDGFLLMALLFATMSKGGALNLDEIRAQLEKLRLEIPGDAFNQALARGRRAQLARSIRGKYAHLLTDSETFIAQKREETRREDSKFGGRP